MYVRLVAVSGICRALIKNHNKNYYRFAEANLLTSYYLKEAFPEKKIFLFDSYKKFFSFEEYTKNDIIILPPNCRARKLKLIFILTQDR